MLDGLEQQVAQFIHRHGLFAEAGGILLAVSGGADSIALLHVLQSLRAAGVLEVEITCAHINHQLRGPASDTDEHFVVEQASQLGLSVVARAVDVRAHARTHGLSLETAARQLRLAGLAEIAHSHKCTWVGTGHQKNDNAETVVHRLRRGTGFRGLAGIRPVRWFGDLRFASPLLCATRREIVQYLAGRGLQWREDHTNADITYTRNYIRHRLLPFLQQEAQGCLVEELSELAASAKRLYDRIERETEEAWSRFVESAEGEVVLHAPGLASLPEPVAIELIRQAMASLRCGGSDMTRLHYKSILQLATENVSGKRVSLPSTFTARREGERIVLSVGRPATTWGRASVPARPKRSCGDARPTSDLAPTVLQVPGRTRFAGREVEARILQRDELDRSKIEGDKGRFREYFDLDRVKLPVVVRLRQVGDRFQPLGMSGEKKVGKFLTTAKVPHDLRERILIFADRERIVWVCPVRISEQTKITESTRRVLELTVSDV
jgi:tRNA(Ile)-lysidine synthase